MEEARKVIDRLERIEALRTAGAAPATVLAQIRQLLVEGEVWLTAERERAPSTVEASARCRARLDALGPFGEGVVAEASL